LRSGAERAGAGAERAAPAGSVGVGGSGAVDGEVSGAGVV
jgi:hypothetical protein